jgi:stage II sporulation protein D
MKKYFLVFFFFTLSVFSFASSLKVGVYTDQNILSFWLSSSQGNYVLMGDGKKMLEIPPKSSLQLIVKLDSIVIKFNGKHTGTFKKLVFLGKEAPNSFKIKPISPVLPERTYDNNLEISVQNKVFKLINRVNIDHYVAGVVESENGIKQNFEYYKAKAIICRTYALSNIRKHEAEGYQLCDRVHCQVYKSKNLLNDDIIMASLASTGVVLVDSELNLITAAFHSNCGGQTVNSEDVWSLPTSYLKSVKDTFCLKMPHAEWEQKVKAADWKNYFIKNHHYKQQDSTHQKCILEYSQPVRETDFISHGMKVPFKTLRTDFKLKSTFFSLEEQNEHVVIRGKGFGHGIGLCQEGAMKMAELGYRYKELLHYYYKDVHLVDLSVLDLFKE